MEQLEKFDADFNQNIAKVERTMDTIGNAMQQCVGILGNLAQAPQHYSQFYSNLVEYYSILDLQNQGIYFNNGVNQNEQYHEKGNTNKT